MMVLPCYVNVTRKGAPLAGASAAPAQRGRQGTGNSTADGVLALVRLLCVPLDCCIA
jgi:hypothetical protein